jgi:hypothetical protein
VAPKTLKIIDNKNDVTAVLRFDAPVQPSKILETRKKSLTVRQRREQLSDCCLIVKGLVVCHRKARSVAIRRAEGACGATVGPTRLKPELLALVVGNVAAVALADADGGLTRRNERQIVRPIKEWAALFRDHPSGPIKIPAAEIKQAC